MKSRMLSALATIGCLGSVAFAGDMIDQDNLETQSFGFGYAVISAQSLGQVFTVGESGTLSLIDVQLWRSPGTTNDVTLRIVSTTGGVPDPIDSGTLATATISIEGLFESNGIPNPGDVPLSTVDVRAAGIVVEPGDQLAIVVSRVGGGAPPWVLWGGSSGYPDGDSYRSDDGTTWLMNGATTGFRTWIGDAAECPEDIDGNGVVEFDDLLRVLSEWGPCEGCPEDVDGDGNVDFDDLLRVLSAWGPCA